MPVHSTNSAAPPPASWITRRCSCVATRHELGLALLGADRQLGQVGQERVELGLGLCLQRGVETVVELVLGQAPGREVVAERVRGLLSLLIGYA